MRRAVGPEHVHDPGDPIGPGEAGSALLVRAAELDETLDPRRLVPGDPHALHDAVHALCADTPPSKHRQPRPV